jgi:hypothetical protein
MNRQHDIEGELHLFDTRQGGRQGPVTSGFMPLHKLYDNYLSSGKHEYRATQCVAPGEIALALVWLITPDVYPGCLWIGRELDIMEGPTRVVGKLTITKIFNEILCGSADSYSPRWTEISRE